MTSGAKLVVKLVAYSGLLTFTLIDLMIIYKFRLRGDRAEVLETSSPFDTFCKPRNLAV